MSKVKDYIYAPEYECLSRSEMENLQSERLKKTVELVYNNCKPYRAKMDELKMSRSFTSRSVNDGFSGGEKKRCDILQMLMLKPKFAILDETDSGLDIDALRIVSEGVNAARSPSIGMLLITHYHRLLEYIKPDKVHVMSGGKIVKSGGAELAVELEQKGYDWIKEAK